MPDHLAATELKGHLDNVYIARAAWRRSPNCNYSFQGEGSKFYSKMHIYLSYSIKMTKWYGKYSAVSYQLPPENLIVGFLCCILGAFSPLLSENAFPLNANLFSYFNKKLQR